MEPSDWISIAATVIAGGSVALHLILRRADKREARHTSVITALQGEKEAVGYEAYRLSESGWPGGLEERKQLLDALCLAFIFERSDRTRALIYRALQNSPAGERTQIENALNKFVAVFADAEGNEVDWDLHRAWNRLAMLGRLLDFDHLADRATQHLENRTPRPG